MYFAQPCCVVVLGINLQGTRHPLALVEGSTKNATPATDLLVGLCDHGLDVTWQILVVLDSSSALRKAVVDVFDHPILARCQLHKIRKVQDKLPHRLSGPVGAKMRAAYHTDSALLAQVKLQVLACEPDETHPRVAASLGEGMAETLTVFRLVVSPTLTRTLRSTNAIESMIGVCRQRSANVKPPKLSQPPAMMTWSAWPEDQRAPPKFHGPRDILATVQAPRSA